jgi:DNA sulfur modification protein DndD
MRLEHAHIENFKLLEDIKLDFSTDPEKPLTVVRAENGSGKTSLLYALLWAFYGSSGLPQEYAKFRLGPAHQPSGKPLDIRVMVEFAHTDETGEESRYRLVRTVTETPMVGDKVDRDRERLRLLRITTAGEEDLQHAEALVGKLIPSHLKDIFFTNGDDVQTYITGRGTSLRQGKVHTAIKTLLGLDSLRIAVDDIDAAYKRLRSDAAQSGGAITSELEEKLEEFDSQISEARTDEARRTEALNNMTVQRTQWDKELNALRGFGDIDELNDRIATAEAELKGFDATRSRAIARMRHLLKSEPCSEAFLGPQLESGLQMLIELADRRVIPGTSLGVLEDRLELEECICGEPLTPGSSHAEHVIALRDEQRKESESQQRLTVLYHTAKQAAAEAEARKEANEDLGGRRTALLAEYTQARDSQRAKAAELEQLTEKRAAIDEDRVRDLTTKIASVDGKMALAQKELGRLESKVASLEDDQEILRRKVEDAEKATKVNRDLGVKRDVAKELLELGWGSLKTLEGDWVHKVSDRMNDLFMEIVGGNPEFEAGVFTRVYIDDEYNIKVDTHDGRTLDTDFELNGASQRALTLSFIWALMEVSGTTAPRIIDTPLGMVAGGVKTRMVDVITKPGGNQSPDFQVVLLLTRSEIRDVEALLDDRAGLVRTLSNSKDFPEDLVYRWNVEHPVSRLCACTHRESCRVCARRYDDQHGIQFRDTEALV